jgi:3-O-alpha-D-mannopyranosyl-alpha-D-mannopyranose xylosylphosphotransferase
MSAADFHNPLYGSILRLDPGLTVSPNLPPTLYSTSGEWGGLQHASQLLSARFPHRPRLYMHHMPKALSKSLVHEASVMFARDLSEAATRGFRESMRGTADIEMAWLVGHLGIERWREALLWTWAVAKVGGVKGVWGEEARKEVRRVLNVRGDVGQVTVIKGERETLGDLENVMGQAGWEMPKRTEYRFCKCPPIRIVHL